MKKVAIIETPFIEPGMPYPEIFRIANVLNCTAAKAIPVDVNVRLFRNMLEEPLSDDVSWTKLISAFADAFFIDRHTFINHINNGNGGINDVSEELIGALRNKDKLKIDSVTREVMARFDGTGRYINHAQYVRDIELFNALLDYKTKLIDDNATLCMEKFSNMVNIQSSAAILGYVNRTDNGLALLYEKYLAHETSSWDFNDVIIIVSNQTQLLPGLALASWMKNKLKFKVILNGSFTDCIFKQNFPSALFDHVDTVIAYSIDYSASAWLNNIPHDHIVLHPASSYPYFQAPVTRMYPRSRGTFAASDLELYFTPTRVIGASVSNRCYWSKCKFCSVSCQNQYPFRYEKAATTIEQIKQLEREKHVNHIQFMDYALPPSFLKEFFLVKGLNVFWSCQARFEKSFLGKGFFSQLFDAGCTSISWGFETGSEKLLKRMNKGGVTDKKNRQKILRTSAEAGILNHLFVITGLPDETKDNFIETVQFIYENVNYISGIEVYPFQLHPCTDIGRTPDIFGLKVLENHGDWSMNLPFAGKPERNTAVERAKYLEDTFGFISKKSETGDYLEGHITFKRPFNMPRLN